MASTRSRRTRSLQDSIGVIPACLQPSLCCRSTSLRARSLTSCVCRRNLYLKRTRSPFAVKPNARDDSCVMRHLLHVYWGLHLFYFVQV